jgi:hypothetical protein
LERQRQQPGQLRAAPGGPGQLGADQRDRRRRPDRGNGTDRHRRYPDHRRGGRRFLRPERGVAVVGLQPFAQSHSDQQVRGGIDPERQPELADPRAAARRQLHPGVRCADGRQRDQPDPGGPGGPGRQSAESDGFRLR